MPDTPPNDPTPQQWWDKLVVSLELADLNDADTRARLDGAAAKANNQGTYLAANWQYGRALPMLTAAIEVWTALEHAAGAVNARNVRGNLYRKIGDYDAAAGDHRAALVQAAEHVLPVGTSAAQTGLALALIALDDLDRAEQLCHEAAQVSEANDDDGGAARAHYALGRVLEARKHWEAAQEAYETARGRWLDLSAPAEQVEAAAGIARTQVARGLIPDATLQVEFVLRHLVDRGPARIEEPLLLYWTLYRVLHTVRDEENAREVLRAANMLMLRQMDGLTAEQRERFRTAVPLHHDIAQTWTAILMAQQQEGEAGEDQDAAQSGDEPGADT